MEPQRRRFALEVQNEAMKTSLQIIINLIFWAVVIGSGYYGIKYIRSGEVLRELFTKELNAVPCEFTLDATQENHIQVPFHHTFDGLHGCVLGIRTNEGMEALPELADASFMEFSLLDGETVVVEGDNSTPCKDIWNDKNRAFTIRPLALLWGGSPHIPHKDYSLDVKVKKPLSESACSALPIVVCYNPCGCVMYGALMGRVIGFGLCLLALGLALWRIWRMVWKR